MPLRQRKGTAREDQPSGRLPRPKGRMRTGAVPPAGIAENIAQLVGPTGSAPGIAKEIDPLVERNADRVVGRDVFPVGRRRGNSLHTSAAQTRKRGEVQKPSVANHLHII